MKATLCALLLLAACQPLATEAHPANPLEDNAVIGFAPADNPLGNQTSTLYAEWWNRVEQCSGLSGDLSAVRWFMLADPDALRFDTIRGPAVGTWVEAENAILLTQFRLTDEKTVQHEMLHALIGHGGHGPLFDACGVRNGSAHD